MSARRLHVTQKSSKIIFGVEIVNFCAPYVQVLNALEKKCLQIKNSTIVLCRCTKALIIARVHMKGRFF